MEYLGERYRSASVFGLGSVGHAIELIFHITQRTCPIAIELYALLGLAEPGFLRERRGGYAQRYRTNDGAHLRCFF